MNYRTTLETVARLITSDAAQIDNATTKRSVDIAATLRDHIKELQKVEKALTLGLTRDVALNRDTEQGKGATLSGINFYSNISETVRWSLDSKAVKAEMGMDWWNERCRNTVVRAVKYFDN